MNRLEHRYIGYYLRPYRWIDKSPLDGNGNLLSAHGYTDCLWETSIEADGFDLQVKVYRDGLFKFGFKRFRDVGQIAKSKKPITINAPINHQEHRLALSHILNVHLVLLWLAIQTSVERTLTSNYAFLKYNYSPFEMWILQSDESEASFGYIGNPSDLDTGLVSHSATMEFIARGANLPEYVTSYAYQSFLANRQAPDSIPLAAVEKSFAYLSDILKHDEADRLIVLIELLSKSLTAFEERDYDWSIMISWAGIEAMLKVQWQKFTKSLSDEKRKNHLRSKKNAADMIEILSWANQLSLENYNNLNRVRSCRNNWIHSLEHASKEDAQLGMDMLLFMLRDIFNLKMN
ncbi:MAG: hypothetical protein J0L63_07925 [Anaerolineae bacterium]|nr:hypothetical protein [Anaerolineae bacterium]